MAAFHNLAFFGIILALMLAVTSAQRALGRYNIDTSGISTSGISSGASMATQFHVAYSSRIMGVATIAGSPYYCAKASVITALNACMNYPGQVDVDELIAQADSYAAAGDIDPTSNMANDRVFILHGTEDSVVNPGMSPLIEEFYYNYLPQANVRTQYSLGSGHAQPTVDYGNDCQRNLSPYINRCNYDAAYELLNWIYGGSLLKPDSSTIARGDFYEYDQKEFFYISPPATSSMDTSGYVYIPSGCLDSQTPCKLHVAFHGCVMGKHELGDEYPRNSGYNEVGELNNIIILYPQADASALLGNMNGCWDWWGYTVDFYATQGANQPLAVIRMVDKLISPSSSPKKNI